MGRSYFRRHPVLAASVAAAALGLVGAGACSSASTTPPAQGGGGGGFGDGGGGGGGHDATVKDTGHMMDVEIIPTGEDAGPGTPCTKSDDCSSLVCEPLKLVDKDSGVDGGIRFDAGVCENPGTTPCQCQPPTCTDGVKNGHETGIDCGGGACPLCGVNVTCNAGTDCVSGECGMGFKGGKCTGLSPDSGTGNLMDCVCEAPTCSDGVLNQDETDVDCGGATCSKCPTGKDCKIMSDCTSDVCTSSLCACPAGMTEAPTSNTVPYCMDTYEITYAQYSAFVGSANAATVAQQPAECRPWNTTFVPTNDWPQVGAEAKNPVNYVNWCDALAYCTSVGHHLCGAIANPTTKTPGGAPVTLVVDGGAGPGNDQSVDEWYNACSSQGQTIYPYGTTYEPDWCNGKESAAQRKTGGVEIPPGISGYTIVTGATSCVLDTSCTAAGQNGLLSTWSQAQQTGSCVLLAPTTGATPACGSAFMEQGCIGGSSTNIIYDLSGNVAEWENSCNATTGASDNCAVRGGSYDSGSQTTLTCALSGAQPPQPRSTTAADIGFRCCL